jgi:hypothetical protein
MATSGNHRPRTRVTSAGRPPWDLPPPPAAPDPEQVPAPGPARPARRSWWWVLPFCGGALAVIVVAAVVIAIRPAGRTPHPAASHPAANTAPLPAQMFPSALFARLTADLQAGNEAGFLAQASPAVRPALKTWWENLHAIGFSTGAVVPTAAQDTVRIDRQGNGSTVVLAGAHSPLDPVGGNGQPDVPLARYRIGLHFASPTATGQITSWQPLDDAPWDAGTALYVRKAPHVVVAGLPGDSALVDQTLPIAETAAAYDVGLVDRVNSRDLNQQKGFIVFVSGAAAVRDRWLAAQAQPPGWPPRFLGAQVFQLPGPGASPDDAHGAGSVSDGLTGGARVVVGPYAQDGNGGTPHSQVVTLVRDFMLDILASHDENLVDGRPAAVVPSWSVEGLAVAVQTLFQASTNPAPARYDFARLAAALARLPAGLKTGALPDRGSQLYGSSTSGDQNWNDVAASVYEYIELKHGMNQMLATAMLLWTRNATPFGNVLKSGAHGNDVFYTASAVKAAWRAWLARA